MHVVSLLPRNLANHLRVVLGEHHSLEGAADPAELTALLRSGDVDLLVVDPSTGGERTGEAIAELIGNNPALPVIVYTVLAPVSMRAIVRLARLGVQHVVLNRFDDEPRRFLDLIERVPAHPLSELMLEELAPSLAAMPVVLARAVEQLYRSPGRARSSAELAVNAGMTLRTLYRHLTPLGLVPRELITSARLLRAYTYLRSPGSRLKEIALKLGYHDPEQLSDQFRRWTGVAPKEIRAAVEPQRFVRLLAEHLRRDEVKDHAQDEEDAGPD